MGLSVNGGDRFLNTLTGRQVTVGTGIRAKLHTDASPSSTDELSGNGYTDVALTATSGTLSTVSGYRKLTLPKLIFFANAGAAAQTAAAFAIWHSTVLMYDQAIALIPNNAEAAVNMPGINFALTSSSTIDFNVTAMDRSIRAFMGQAASDRSMFWALHHGSATPSHHEPRHGRRPRARGGGRVDELDGRRVSARGTGLHHVLHGADRGHQSDADHLGPLGEQPGLARLSGAARLRTPH